MLLNECLNLQATAVEKNEHAVVYLSQRGWYAL